MLSSILENIDFYHMSFMICSDIKALVMARCLECVASTSYGMAHTDDGHCELWTVGWCLPNRRSRWGAEQISYN